MVYQLTQRTDSPVFENQYVTDTIISAQRRHDRYTFGNMSTCIGLVGISAVTKEYTAIHLAPTCNGGEFNLDDVEVVQRVMHPGCEVALFGNIEKWRQNSRAPMEALIERLEVREIFIYATGAGNYQIRSEDNDELVLYKQGGDPKSTAWHRAGSLLSI